jgi:hypothetical protein
MYHLCEHFRSSYVANFSVLYQPSLIICIKNNLWSKLMPLHSFHPIAHSDESIVKIQTFLQIKFLLEFWHKDKQVINKMLLLPVTKTTYHLILFL